MNYIFGKFRSRNGLGMREKAARLAREINRGIAKPTALGSTDLARG